ncbi:MAG TPA: AcvB/VirJ family lysyl-phosphatidylglycerol hydrolase [Longimicrobiaceae bacterium]|jgi:type IV secretory pathway VirJ component|nr:AcvB/VirJ family lysyl-phosphatidylglycerol hydrolase [Longimicrobiaceae bacterium]
MRALLVWALLCGSAAVAAAQAPATLPALGLPLVEVPVPAGQRGDMLGVLLTSDGGWTPVNRVVSERLAQSGVPVVAWNSMHYYRTPRSPDEAARALARVIEHYSAAWGRGRVVLIGYSFGADVMPFLVNRLPPADRARIAGMVLMGFDRDAVFEFHYTDWLGRSAGPAYATLPEIRRLGAVPTLCLYGTDDAGTACTAHWGPAVTAVALHAGHRFGAVSEEAASLIVQDVRALAARPTGA